MNSPLGNRPLLAFALLLATISSELCANEDFRVAQENSFVQVLQCGEHHEHPAWTYVITHGLGGTRSGDRFHQLAAEIRRCFPKVNVYLTDWTQVAAQKTLFGLPSVWKVAANIDNCAQLSADALQHLSLDPSRSTLIGESFGCYVNFGIARQLGKVERMLCFNAASQLGGYVLPDMTTVASACYAFQTISIFDTQARLSDHDVRLQLARGTVGVGAHTSGIRWLSESLQGTDRSWILCSRELPLGTVESFAGTVRPNGEFDPTPVPRIVEEQDALVKTDTTGNEETLEEHALASNAPELSLASK